MTRDDETEQALVEAMIKLDRAQETAPLTVSGMLDDVIVDLDHVLRVYREKHTGGDKS